MATLQEVVRGLRNGHHYKHELEMGGWEYVRPTEFRSAVGYTCFSHTVDGKDFGGYNEMHIATLNNGRWATDGWERLK